MLTHQPLIADRQPVATGWTSEVRLVDALEAALRAEPPDRGIRTRLWREFDTGCGRADLLAVNYDVATVAARRRVGEPAGEFGLLEGHALSLLRPGLHVRSDDLRAKLRIGPRRCERLVDTLVARGLAAAAGGVIRLAPARQVWTLRAVVAYEAKLDKWRAAAEQACRHAWFASRACVVMPALGATAARRAAELCRQWRLGFWVFDGRGRPTNRPAAVPRTPLGWVLNERVFEECCRAAG